MRFTYNILGQNFFRVQILFLRENYYDSERSSGRIQALQQRFSWTFAQPYTIQ